VWFRGASRREALRLGLRGWVRNRDDGTVEIVAEGPAGPVAEFMRWCHHGPAGAQVTEVRARAEPADDTLADFRIRS